MVLMVFPGFVVRRQSRHLDERAFLKRSQAISDEFLNLFADMRLRICRAVDSAGLAGY